MNPTRMIWYAITGLILLLLQLNAGLIAVEKVAPDLLLIYIVVIALLEGQFTAILVGFTAGLLFDLVSNDVIGSNALAKLIVGFIAGFFYEEGMEPGGAIGTFRFLGIVALTSFLHNIIYYFFYVQPAELSFLSIFLRGGLPGMLYTTVLSALVMLVAARKKSW